MEGEGLKAKLNMAGGWLIRCVKLKQIKKTDIEEKEE